RPPPPRHAPNAPPPPPRRSGTAASAHPNPAAPTPERPPPGHGYLEEGGQHLRAVAPILGSTRNNRAVVALPVVFDQVWETKATTYRHPRRCRGRRDYRDNAGNTLIRVQGS